MYFSFFKVTPVFPAGFEFTWWKFTGGLLGVVYVTAVVIAAPRIGAANALGFIVAGQFVAAVIIDHFGLLGMPVYSISWWRIAGIVILICGVYLIQKK
jgi:transporter family-2 protein